MRHWPLIVTRRGLNIILVARNKERLSQVAKEIQETYHVKTEIIVVDFTDSSATKKAVKESKDSLKNLYFVNVTRQLQLKTRRKNLFLF